jgi:hypothetical protein
MNFAFSPEDAHFRTDVRDILRDNIPADIYFYKREPEKAREVQKNIIAKIAFGL